MSSKFKRNEDDSTFIIGAGPAGLTAAYLLTKEQLPTTVIEADHRYVGGLSRTVSYKDFLFDIGGHRFFSKSQEVVELWHELLPDDLIVRTRASRIYYDGKYYSYPLRAFEALRNLGAAESARCLVSYALRKALPHKNPKSFHQWVANQFGERLFSIFFKTYTEKVWGISCDEISADWAAQRIKGLNLWAAASNGIRRSLNAKTAAPTPKTIKTLIESFEYPRKGPGMMWEAATAKTKAQGGEVHMSTTLESLSWDPEFQIWRIAATNDIGETRNFTAKHVVSSAPIRHLVGCLSPRPLCWRAAENLSYRDFIMVALIVRSPHLFPDNWIYIHDPAVKVGRIQNFRSWSPDMVPDENLSCVGLEYFCFKGDGLWSSSDAELIALARREIAYIGLIREDEVIDGCVVRQEKAYPVYDAHYRRNIETIRQELEEKYPTLHLVGRNGMHKYNNQDHAMMTAMLTVRNILAGRKIYDVWSVNEDAQYHESGTVHQSGRVPLGDN
jgi:protoporphyrinogen oxidase